MWKYRSFFALLYFIQGAVLAYVVNFQKPYLFAHGVSKASLGLFTSLLLIPFILKVFLGMLSDRVPLFRLGSRKPYMILGLTLFALSYARLATVDPTTHFARFAGLSWLASLGLAWFDTCADGWAVDVADEHEQGYIQASMIGGKSIGLILMSFGFGWIAKQHGFHVIFLILAAMALAILLVIGATQHRPRPMSQLSYKMNWKDLLRPFYFFFAVFAIVYSIASFGTDGLITLHLADVRHVDSIHIGIYGVGRGLGALLGAGLNVMAQERWGLKRTQVIALLCLGVGCLTPLIVLPFLLSGLIWGVCWGFQETSFVTLSMRYAQGPWAASLFALCMIFSNLGTSLGEAVAAPMVPHLGYVGVFSAFALLAWGCTILVPKIMPPEMMSSV